MDFLYKLLRIVRALGHGDLPGIALAILALVLLWKRRYGKK